MKIIQYVSSVMTGIMLLLSTSSVSAASLLQQKDFTNWSFRPWQLAVSDNTTAYQRVTDDGEYCVTINNPGIEVWDIQLRHREMKIVAGHVYQVKFKVHADKACKIYAKIGDQRYPHGESWSKEIILEPDVPVLIDDTFTGKQHDLAELNIFMGGRFIDGTTTPVKIYFDDFELMDPLFTPTPYVSPTPRQISETKVNQLGYQPNAVKKATVKTLDENPLTWQLKDSSGTIVADCKTIPFGLDEDSYDNVQIIDFSDFKTPGTGYTLSVIGANMASNSFDISPDIYDTMQKDALQYFYYARSGTPIVMPYAVKEEWTRPAGHTEDKKVNMSSYILNCSGGWYDTGDYRKSATTGSTSVWKLMNQYEHAKTFGKAIYGSKDGDMNIPENTNGIPDILDEAKWEMDFLTNMQVPYGAKEGMVHHELADFNHVPLGSLPDYITYLRNLKAPSTVATLDFTAVAAQAARVFKTHDNEASAKYLQAAEKAWNAAIANPNIIDPNILYPNNYKEILEDDFYWAACELYATTGKEKYYDYLKNSKLYLTIQSLYDSSAMGTLSLSLSGILNPSEKALVKENIAKSCDNFISTIKSQGYGIPIKSEYYMFPFSSNEDIINSAIILGYAYDFTGDVKYYNGISEGMDYIMGRNPLDKCYVTGYGDAPVRNIGHCFFANQYIDTFPKAPAGFLVSGPYSSPFITIGGRMLAPEKCYVEGQTQTSPNVIDYMESWETNQVSTRLNSSLAWVTSYLSCIKCPESMDKIIYGDLNNDGKVDTADYTLLRRYLLGIIQEMPAADWKVRADVAPSYGKIDSGDYTYMRKFLLKQITEFPVASANNP